MTMFCKNKYRLELHWDSLEYHDDSNVNLMGAKFTGPVLKDALRLEAPDSIDLDFTPQMLTLMDNYYIITLSWDKCQYTQEGIKLQGARLSNKHLKTLHKIEKKDYVVIDTEKHEEDVHAFNLVYESRIMRNGE